MMIVIHSKILYIFTRIIKIIVFILSKDLLQGKKSYELRCKDRLNCKGRAKYIIVDKTIIVSQKCSIDYE